MSNSAEHEAPAPRRVLSVIADANVLVHGKALVDLPWGELGRPDIEIVFVPPVVREIDKLKTQPGRPNGIARQLSKDIRALLTMPERRATLSVSSPTVSKRVETRSVTESLRDTLRLDHADQALINYALHLAADYDVLLLTDDTFCALTAEEAGLATHLMPDHWLRDPELDETAKENARLKTENKRLIAAEPQIQLEFRDPSGATLQQLVASVTHWPALSDAEIEGLMADVVRLCPSATSFTRSAPASPSSARSLTTTATSALSRLSALQPRTVYEPATPEEIERYQTTLYPAWLSSVRESLQGLHERLQDIVEWPSVVAAAVNKGTRSAIGALLTITAHGAFAIYDEDVNRPDEGDEAYGRSEPAAPVALPLPPHPPRGRQKMTGGIGLASRFAHGTITHPFSPLGLLSHDHVKPRESDAFYWRGPREGWLDQLQLECVGWRHRKDEQSFVLRLRPEHLSATRGAIELRVEATNLSSPASLKLPVRLSIDACVTFDIARELVAQLGCAASAQGRL